MKILFVHDHKFYKVGSWIYSSGGLNNAVFSRYTKYCDEFHVVARILEEKVTNGKWSLISDSKVRICGNKSLFNRDDLEREIKDCDRVIVRLPSFLGLAALDINKKYHKPYLIESVGCAWDALWNHGFVGKIIAPYYYYITKRKTKMAPYVCYVTKEFLQRRYPSGGRTIGCSDVEIPTMNLDVEIERLSRIKSCKKPLKLGTVAGIDVAYKGQIYVIKALGRLKKQGNTSFTYYLLGGGDNTRLKNAAQRYDVLDQVVFVGSLPHEKVLDWLDTIDVYVQPSKQEGLPRAMVEAMSRGLPTIGSKTGGIPELIADEYVFKRGDVKGIAKLLETLDEEKMMKMSKVNFEKARDFQKNLLDEKRDDFYRSFIQG